MGEAVSAPLAPVSGKARIDVLDMLRGLAILGIFFMNAPFMGASLPRLLGSVQAMGWTPVDEVSWWIIQVLLEGTQRGLLELLFGAGMMVLAARAMEPDGPVAVADLYLRRNLWLLGFGLLDVFVLGWAGDILHVYALAALFLFPFRKLTPRVLVLLGLGYAAWIMGSGALDYRERAQLVHTVEAAEHKEAAHVPLDAAEKEALEDWRKKVENMRTGGPEVKVVAELEKKGRSGGLLAYLGFNIGIYLEFVFPSLVQEVAEALCMMLLGVALWKWGIIQGQRSARFYLVLMLVCYAPGFALRAFDALQLLQTEPLPRVGWITRELARIAVSIGHVALVNLLVKSVAGYRVLSPFKAAGRTAFSLYFMQQIVGLWILFAPWGPGLWNKLGWGGLAGVVLAVIAVQVVIANLWLRWFVAGPMEWSWRSLAYLKRQPFRRQPPAPAPELLPA